MVLVRMVLCCTWLGVGAAAARAEVELPPESVGPDTVFVVRADAHHLTPDLLRTAVNGVLGDNADRAKDFVATFTDRYERLTRAGLESITVIGTSTQRISDAEREVAADPNAPPRRRMQNPPVIYLHVAAGADVHTIEDVLTQGSPEAQRADLRFEQLDNWIVMHDKDQNPPEKVDADRGKAFAQALDTLPDAAAALAVIPDVRLKGQMEQAAARDETPKFLKAALPILAASQFMTIGVALGNDPNLKLSVKALDQPSAQKLSDAVGAALDEFKAQINDGQGGGRMAFIGVLVGPMLDAFRPSTAGAVVTVSLRGETLTSMSNLIFTLRSFAPPPGGPNGPGGPGGPVQSTQPPQPGTPPNTPPQSQYGQ